VGVAGVTDLFFADSADGERPLLVFHHIRKTAGTSVRFVLKSKLWRTERVMRWTPGDQGHPPSREVAEWYRDLYDELDAEARDRLCCVASHSANQLLPVLDRPALAVSLVRDPVDRVLSRYYFSHRPKKPNPPKPNPPKREAARLVRSSRLEEIYARAGGSPRTSERHRLLAQFFNGQARSLLDPHCDTSELAFTEGPGPDADLWRERLHDVVGAYALIGLRERIDEFMAALGRELGWKARRLPRKKLNPDRPAAAELDGYVIETIRRCNWLDEELYQLCGEAFEARSLRLRG
jgi:Sulfotransferase family